LAATALGRLARILSACAINADAFFSAFLALAVPAPLVGLPLLQVRLQPTL